VNESSKAVVEVWFEGQDREFFFQGISSLPVKWQKCTDIAGDYNEKLQGD